MTRNEDVSSSMCMLPLNVDCPFVAANRTKEKEKKRQVRIFHAQEGADHGPPVCEDMTA
jgi:predicted metal-binding protein